MAYYRSRLPSPAWAPVLAPLWLVDRAFRRLGRRRPTTAVGAEIAAYYGAPRPNVIEFEVNLVRAGGLPEAPREGGWGDPGRDADGGPDRAREAAPAAGRGAGDPRALRARRLPCDLGRRGQAPRGPARAADRLGVGDSLELPGFVAFGEPLLRRYREADAYVHVALTEGMPGVICEAMANGLPIVATDVGGVAAATGDGEAALLVPAGDAQALASALLRLKGDPGLRRELASAGLERARRTALDVESRRVADFLGARS